MNKAPVLEVRGLFKYFPVKQSLLRRVDNFVKAVDDVSFTLGRGEVLAIVGESGCGKTTIARTLIGLEEQTDGEILFHGEIVGTHERRARAGLAPLESGGAVGTREHLDAAAHRPQASAPAGANDLPGSVRIAEPALDHLRDRGRAAGGAWTRARRTMRGLHA